MTKDEFIATLKIMKWKKETPHRYIYDSNAVMLYSHSAVTTIDKVSNYHTSYEKAINRISKKI